MTIKNRIMYELATKQIAPITALLLMGKEPDGVRRQIRSLIRDGLIKEVTYRFYSAENKACRKQETHHCYVLTSDGLRYVQRKLGKRVDWMSQITIGDDLVLASIKGPYRSGTPKSHALLLTSIAAITADLIGAEESLLIVGHAALTEEADHQEQTPENTDDASEEDIWDLDDDDDFWYLDDEDISDSDNAMEASGNDPPVSEQSGTHDTSAMENQDALDRRKPTELAAHILAAWSTRPDPPPVTAQDPSIRFTSFLSIKNSANLSSQDVGSARMIGILESAIRAAIIYMPTNTRPVSFQRTVVNQELSICRHANFDFSDTRRESILLVSSPKELAATYQFKKNQVAAYSAAHQGQAEKIRKYSRRWYDCGEIFTHMYVVPISHTGTLELRHIMTHDIDQEYRELTNDTLRETDDVYLQEYKTSRYIGMIDVFDLCYIMGTHIDLVQVRDLEIIASKDPEREYHILCQEWQMPYYEAILEHCKPVPLSDYYDAYRDIDKVCTQPKMACERNAKSV